MKVKTKTSDNLAIFIQIIGKTSFVDCEKFLVLGLDSN